MAHYSIRLDGEDGAALDGDYTSAEEARNAAVVLLGGQLQKDPGFAYRGHWRVEVRDNAQRLLLHVIVATVPAAPPINWASFDRNGQSPPDPRH